VKLSGSVSKNGVNRIMIINKDNAIVYPNISLTE
jgi:hypothetical protein